MHIKNCSSVNKIDIVYVMRCGLARDYVIIVNVFVRGSNCQGVSPAACSHFFLKISTTKLEF